MQHAIIFHLMWLRDAKDIPIECGLLAVSHHREYCLILSNGLHLIVIVVLIIVT